MSTASQQAHRLLKHYVSTHAPLDDKWDHEYGVLLRGLMDLYQQSGEAALLDFTRRSLDPLIDGEGTIRGYRMDDYEMDNIISGRALLSLYRLSGDPRYEKAARLLRKQFDSHPKSSFGTFLHKKALKEILLIDSTYMGMPFLAEFESLLGTGDYASVCHSILTAYRLNYDAARGLLTQGYDATRSQDWADPVTGRSASLWGRGLGWYLVGCVEVLDYLPADRPEHKEIRELLAQLLKGVLKLQDASGAWYQVLDQGGREGNYLEASASGMFTYCLLKALRKGYLDASFRPQALKAYEGLVNTFVKEDGGSLKLVGTCASAGLGGKPGRDGSFQSYAREATRDNDLKGLGVLGMATAALEALN